MAEVTKNQPCQWWWLETHSTTVTRSPWLQSTLSELNEKTKAMLKVIEEDADSFAKRAEMYYKKRPELVNMVQDFYRAHRLLAERYDQVRPDTGVGLLSITGGSPFASAKHRFEKLVSLSDRGYDTYSESCGLEDYESVESEVDDPDQEGEEEEEEEEETNSHNWRTSEEKVSFVAVNGEVMRLRDEVKRLNEENMVQKDQHKQKEDAMCDEAMMLREEIERLRGENEAQKEQLKQKDEEKIEAIRHLSFAIDVLKQENVKMRSFIAWEESKKKLKNDSRFVFNKFLGAFSDKFFNGPPKNEPGVELSKCGSPIKQMPQLLC